MAVTFDAVGPAGGAGTNSSTTPLTWTHVNGGNAILIGVTSFGGNTNQITGVTYGGVTIPLLGYIPSGNASGGGIALYGLQGATVPSGSNTVSAAFTGVNDKIGGSVSYSGAGSLSAGTTNYGTSGNLVSTAIVTHTGGILVAAGCDGSSGTWGVTSGNLRWSDNASGGSASDNAAGGDIASTGASQTITFTNSASDDWGIVAAEVIPPTGTNTSPAWATAYDTTAVAGTGTWTNPANAEGTGSSGGPWATWTAP